MIDVILHDFIDDKISEIVSNPSLLNLIFDGYPHDTIESIKQFILSNKIRTVYHFPRDATELPCYAIILENSSESDQIIGMAGDFYDEILISDMEDGWVASDSDKIRDNVLAPVDIVQFYSALETKQGRRCCHIIGKKNTSALKGIWIDCEHSVLGYKSLVGCRYVTFWIKSNRIGSFLKFGFGKGMHEEHAFPFAVTTRNLWERIRIDISGVPDREKDKIRFMSFRLMDDSEYTDVYIDKLCGEGEYQYRHEEAYFDHNYRIEVWTNNAELTLYLFEIIKWNILRHRTYLETSWGFIRQRVTGGDIVPQPEYYPEFVYIRALNYNCTTVEIIPTEERFALEVKVGKIDWGN